VATSLVSRALRSTELRITSVTFNDEARRITSADPDRIIRVVAHRPRTRTIEEYDAKDENTRKAHHLTPDEHIMFIEVDPADASDFRGALCVEGITVGRHMILRTRSAAIPNAIAAILLALSQSTGRLAHAYFGWTEGNPIGYLFRFFFLGEGDVAPITREVLRKAIPNPDLRPSIHVS
jgi:hypothetical protein